MGGEWVGSRREGERGEGERGWRIERELASLYIVVAERVIACDSTIYLEKKRRTIPEPS